MRNLKDEIREKKLQIRILEQRMVGSVERMPQGSINIEISQVNLKKKSDAQILIIYLENLWSSIGAYILLVNL